MKFKEAFEHYKAGSAVPEEIEYVEEALEKNRLISEYLADDFTVELEAGESPAEELKNVRKTIRRRSRNIIIITLAFAAALALILNFVGVPLLDRYYYNPMARNYDPYSYDIDMSLSAYTELFSPDYYHGQTIIEHTGIGRYEMTMTRSNLATGEEEFLSATLDRNILSAPRTLTESFLPANVFARASYPTYDLDRDIREAFEKEMAELPDYVSVQAYVSFSEDIAMDQLADLMRGGSVSFLWAGIRNAPGKVQRFPLCGMELTGTGIIFENINETYPAFELGLISGKARSGADYENHFISLLRYSIDHADFLKAIGEDRDLNAYCRSVLDYVTENGVKTYGVLVQGSAADILALKDSGVVSQIWPFKADITF